jgi:creatinine amidohydrolase
MLHAHPELVRTDEIVAMEDRPLPQFAGTIPMDPPFDQNIAFHQATAAEYYEKTGGRGFFSNPAAATAEKGKRILEVTVDSAAEFIASIKDKPVECARPPIPV